MSGLDLKSEWQAAINKKKLGVRLDYSLFDEDPDADGDDEALDNADDLLNGGSGFKTVFRKIEDHDSGLLGGQASAANERLALSCGQSVHFVGKSPVVVSYRWRTSISLLSCCCVFVLDQYRSAIADFFKLAENFRTLLRILRSKGQREDDADRPLSRAHRRRGQAHGHAGVQVSSVSPVSCLTVFSCRQPRSTPL